MGVLGLWNLIEPVGQPLALETLENKVLAIDISIWINQVIKGFRDKNSSSIHNAHLIGLFHRICKLMFFKIKPVFVFDGKAPILKQQTLEERRSRRSKMLLKSRTAANKVIASYLSAQLEFEEGINVQIEQQDSSVLLSSFLPTGKADQDEDIFFIPDIPSASSSELMEREIDAQEQYARFVNSKLREFQRLDDIDFNSADFKTLAPEVRFEILTQLKERRTEWSQLRQLPDHSNNFSSYQMSRLLHINALQREIDKTIEELNADLDEDGQAKAYNVASESNVQYSYRSSKFGQGHRLIRPRKGSPPRRSNKPCDLQFYDAAEYDYGKSEAVAKDGCSVLKDIRLKIESNEDSLSNESSTSQPVSKDNISKSDKSIQESSKAASSSQVDKQSSSTIVLDDSDLIGEAEIITGVMSEDEYSSNSSITNEDMIAEKIESNVQDIAEQRKPCDTSSSLPTISEEHIPQETSKESPNIANSTESPIKFINQETSNQEPSVDVTNEDSLGEHSTSEVIVNNEKQNPFIESINQNETEKDTPSIDNEYSSINDVPINTENQLKADQEDELWEDDDEEFIEAFRASQSSTASNSQSTPSKKPRVEIKITSPTSITREEIAKLRQSNQVERQAEKVTEKMIEECKELLHLFGIPYVCSPAEAESQCAALEFIGLTDGTITDDSDIWLFGADKVYKNFFTQSKYVEAYKASEIETHFKLDRERLICFALLTGSDYTTGIDGVGPVTAIEILNEFKGKGFDCLQEFRKWWDHKRTSSDKTPSNKVRAKLLKLRLEDSFPSRVVFDAYISPNVDASPERFTWAKPDLDLIRQFARNKLGWPQAKVDEPLLPVLKKLNEDKTQTRIDSFFQPVAKNSVQQIATKSKRLANALNISPIDKLPTAGSSPISKRARLKEQVQRQRVASRAKRNLSSQKTDTATASTSKSNQGAKVTNRNSKSKPQRQAPKAIEEICLSESSESSED